MEESARPRAGRRDQTSPGKFEKFALIFPKRRGFSIFSNKMKFLLILKFFFFALGLRLPLGELGTVVPEGVALLGRVARPAARDVLDLLLPEGMR